MGQFSTLFFFLNVCKMVQFVLGLHTKKLGQLKLRTFLQRESCHVRGGGIQTQVWNFPHFFFPLRTLPLGQNFILEAFKLFLLQLSIRCFLKLCSEVFAALERTARQDQTATRDVPAAASSLINSPHLLTPEESTRENINRHSSISTYSIPLYKPDNSVHITSNLILTECPQ